MRIINSESTKYLSTKLHYNFMPKYKICLTQIQIEQNFSESIKKITNIIRIASENLCQMVIFPEDSLYGVIRGKQVEEINYQEQKTIEIFTDLSRKHSIEILAPTVPKQNNNEIYNSSTYISHKYNSNNTYRKINLWLTEKDDYATGEIQDLKCLDSDIGKIGQTICWDLQNTEIYMKYKELGADIVINQAFWYRHRTKKLRKNFGETSYLWPYTDYQMVDNLNLARSNENGIITLFVNSAGEYRNLPENEIYKPIGISQVVFPGIGVVAKAPRNKECLLIVDLPDYQSILKDYRTMYGL